MATISTLLDIGLLVWLQYPLWFDALTTISTLWYGYNIHFIRHWFDGMATISTLLDIGLMVWLQYPLC